MIRNLFLALAIAATAATAYAAVAPHVEGTAPPDRNVTVIEKNQAFPAVGPIAVNACATEDCSEVQS